MHRTLIVAFALIWAAARANEVISDLGDLSLDSSSFDEGRASNIKNEQFWQPLLKAAESIKMESHLALYADADAVIESLPTECSYVREALTEALMRLKRADDQIL